MRGRSEVQMFLFMQRSLGERGECNFFIRLTVCTEGGIVRSDVADLVVLGLDG